MNHLNLSNTKQGEATLTDRQKKVLETYNQRHAANLQKWLKFHVV
jgi:hypothetical protein